MTGSSSGIGKSTAIEFAKDDRFKVWATMRSADQWDAESRDNLIIAEMDVTIGESVDALVSRIIAVEGRIDIVVNNAGYGVAGCLEVVHLEEAKQLFDVNVWVSICSIDRRYSFSNSKNHLITGRCKGDAIRAPAHEKAAQRSPYSSQFDGEFGNLESILSVLGSNHHHTYKSINSYAGTTLPYITLRHEERHPGHPVHGVLHRQQVRAGRHHRQHEIQLVGIQHFRSSQSNIVADVSVLSLHTIPQSRI